MQATKLFWGEQVNIIVSKRMVSIPTVHYQYHSLDVPHTSSNKIIFLTEALLD